MEDIDYKKIASEFIANWQENFAKTMQDSEIMVNLTKANGFMQQFYDNKSTSAAANSAPKFSNDELYWQQLSSRIAQLEERIAKLESANKSASSGKRSAKSGKKKAT